MAKKPPTPKLHPLDQEDLKIAVQQLEHPGFAARVADIIGTPLDKVMNALPEAASKSINLVSEKAMRVALDLSLRTMRKGRCDASPRMHKLASAVTGAVGGAAGLAGLTVELPVTTAIMFRAIADIARAEGEDLKDPKVCMACLEVFALGGPQKGDDTADSVYFGARVALAQSVREATKYLAKGVATKKTAPALVRLITKIAARFGLVVSYKAAAQIVPVIGAVGGAAINTLFMNHFQNMAKGHFTIRRLERKYGADTVRQAYEHALAEERREDRTIGPKDDEPGPTIDIESDDDDEIIEIADVEIIEDGDVDKIE